MPSFLENQLPNALFAGFKGKTLQGRLRRTTSGASGDLDAEGDPTAVGADFHALEGFPDNFSAYFRATAGIPEADVKLCIFARSLPAGITPSKDDQIGLTRNGVETWYQLRKDATDPAEALWECQAFVIDTPEDA